MAKNDADENHALTYVQDEPDVLELKNAYDTAITDLGWFMQASRDSFDYRRNQWVGKSKDLRKHGADAFPWEGAADTEVPLIDERINTYVALFMLALQRANIRAYPTEIGDMGRARVVSAFLKWMVSTYIPQFKRQMELGANYLLEKGIMITYVGWQKEDHTYLQSLTLEEIGQYSPDLVRLIMEGESDKKIVELFLTTFKGATEKRAKRALKDLRKTGKAQIPTVRRSVDCPCIESLAADGDWFFPAYTTDPQQAPYCFWRRTMTPQELVGKRTTEGWDAEWVDKAIDRLKGRNDVADPRANNRTISRSSINTPNDLIEVVYCYQRLVDPEDGAEGIYCTVFAPDMPNREDGTPFYAKHELLNGYDDYPVVVTKLGEDNKRLYDLTTIPELLRGIQWQVKVERDARIDRNSLATVPPLMHPVGAEPKDWGPGVRIAYRRQGEIQYAPVPQYNAGSVEMETTQIEQADRAMGLDMENPLSTSRQQFFVNKFLTHVQDVLKLAYKCYQRFGPDQVFFRVTGVSDPQKFSKGSPDEDFDINISFDVLSNDPETLEKQLQQFASLLQFDRNGRIDMDLFLEAMAASVNPGLADAVLRPAEQAQQQVVKGVTDDLSKIYAGIEVGARPNGAQVAMQTIQQYVQQPDVMERLQNDKAFQARLEKYVQQYQFQLQQAQNAQIGKIGTAPAAMGNVGTQGMQTQ